MDSLTERIDVAGPDGTAPEELFSCRALLGRRASESRVVDRVLTIDTRGNVDVAFVERQTGDELVVKVTGSPIAAVAR